MEENITEETKAGDILEGTKKERDDKKDEILEFISYGESDRVERKRVIDIRRDFFEGNHGKYTNITGLNKKEKNGHANAVINYAGMTAIKLYYSVGNNPPKTTLVPLDITDEVETINTQMTEQFCEKVMWMNKFWKRGYKRGAIKIFPNS